MIIAIQNFGSLLALTCLAERMNLIFELGMCSQWTVNNLFCSLPVESSPCWWQTLFLAGPDTLNPSNSRRKTLTADEGSSRLNFGVVGGWAGGSPFTLYFTPLALFHQRGSTVVLKQNTTELDVGFFFFFWLSLLNMTWGHSLKFTSFLPPVLVLLPSPRNTPFCPLVYPILSCFPFLSSVAVDFFFWFSSLLVLYPSAPIFFLWLALYYFSSLRMATLNI